VIYFFLPIAKAAFLTVRQDGGRGQLAHESSRPRGFLVTASPLSVGALKFQLGSFNHKRQRLERDLMTLASHQSLRQTALGSMRGKPSRFPTRRLSSHPTGAKDAKSRARGANFSGDHGYATKKPDVGCSFRSSRPPHKCSNRGPPRSIYYVPSYEGCIGNWDTSLVPYLGRPR
jgi:hypothetical protein